MQSGWVRWIAYGLLTTLVIVTSCQAMSGTVAGAAVASSAITGGAITHCSIARCSAQARGPSAAARL